jgi:hypothetical protein
MSVWSWLKLTAALWLIRTAFRALGRLLAAAVAVAAWPVTMIAAAGYTAAWLRGWPPARLYRAACWSLAMTGVYALAAALQLRTWQAVALAPVRDWRTASGWLAAGRVLPAVLLMLPVAVPAGLAAGGIAWAWRVYAIAAGTAGRAASAPVTFDARQWRRQVRTARGRIAAPGAVPLLTRDGRVPVGGTIRAVRHRWHPVLSVPYGSFMRHMVIIGSSGCGKTNLMIRMWAGWYAAALAAASTGEPRPLLCALDCKGGPDARAKAARTRRLLHSAGARRVAIWPDEARLSLWTLPARDLAVLLFQMIETGDGPAAYYADVTQAIITLAVTAPQGPPDSATAFLDRLDASWLSSAYADHPRELAAITAAARTIGDVQLRYQTLMARLGPGLDGPGSITDADAWYFILEGTAEPSVAEAQAMALTELIAHAATSPDTEPRSILLAADDYSAVSRRVPLSNLYERGRSLGLGVMVSAQSWHGLGKDEDERYRIAATADGGIWVMRTPYPEPLAHLAGTRQVLESAHMLTGAAWGDRGTTRIQHAWKADPDLIRTLTTGQACWIHGGGTTYVQVARPRSSPLCLPAARQPAMTTVTVPPAPDTDTVPLPVLDDVLGPPAGGTL